MSKIDEKKRNKKNAIMNSAFELFTEKGLENTSVLDITFRAGVAKGTFYLYFKDKADVQKKLILFHTTKLFTESINMIDDCVCDVTDAIIFITSHIIDEFVKNPKLVKFIAKNLNWGLFQNTLDKDTSDDSEYCKDYFFKLTKNKISNPTFMLFMIMELVGGTCYSSIIEKSIESMDTSKPLLLSAVRGIIEKFEIS